MRIRDVGWHPTVILEKELDASSANVRGVVFSARFTKPYEIIDGHLFFEDNTQDSCKARLWLTSGTTTRSVIASAQSSAGEVPVDGRNLFAGGGLDYMTGDGPMPYPVRIGLQAEGPFYLCLDVDNTDTPNVHAVRLHLNIRELI